MKDVDLEDLARQRDAHLEAAREHRVSAIEHAVEALELEARLLLARAATGEETTS